MKKIVMGMCMAGAMAMSVQSFAGCTEGDCVNGHGTYEWSDGTRYTGDIGAVAGWNAARSGAQVMLTGG